MKNAGLVWVLTMGALAACGGDDPPTPYTLTFAGTAPTGLVAQDGDGGWQPVAYVAGGATFDVTAGFHAWAVKCDGFSFVRVNYDAGDRGRPIEPCGGVPAAAVHLRGQLTPNTAEVFVGLNGSAEPAGTDGSYDVARAPGTYDVVALATDGPRALIHRGQDLTVDATLDLDLATGFDRVLAPVTVTGAGAAAVSLGSELHTHDGTGTYVPMLGTADAVWLVPPAQRVATDRMVALAYAESAGTTQIVQRFVSDATAPTLAFAAFPTIAGDRSGATWGATPDMVYTWLRSTTNPPVTVTMNASGAWQAARGGAGALPWFDPSVVGAPTFEVGTTLDWSISVEVGDRAGELTLDSRDATLTW
ncbi:MAG: hypothetical protein IPL61_26540 [Myxococcales bacterium]|nr:hypothetical protein [Myxococcales bacterium]